MKRCMLFLIFALCISWTASAQSQETEKEVILQPGESRPISEICPEPAPVQDDGAKVKQLQKDRETLLEELKYEKDKRDSLRSLLLFRNEVTVGAIVGLIIFFPLCIYLLSLLRRKKKAADDPRNIPRGVPNWDLGELRIFAIKAECPLQSCRQRYFDAKDIPGHIKDFHDDLRSRGCIGT